jgi:hypothetical protein
MYPIARRTPALEWALWKTWDDGAKKIDVNKLDQGKLHLLSSQTELLKALDNWILSPDRNLLPSLTELAKIVNRLYNFKELQLYRGFDMKLGYQDNMGLSGTPEQNKHYEYRCHSPLSFSTDLSIAQTFGSVVVLTHLNVNQTDALVVTDELATLVCQLRNIAPETQKEVIVFPPAVVKFEVIEK